MDDHSKKVVTHRFDFQQRAEDHDYEQGVSIELCPLFDFSVEPWTLLRHLIRELTLAHLVYQYTRIHKESKQIKLLDVACGYAELWTLLSRQMKYKGSRIEYIGVDIDEDKRIIAHQLRPSVDYRIMDMMRIREMEEAPFDVVVCGETIEHVEEERGREFFAAMVDVLVPGGYLILSVPTPESELHRQNPFHLRLWDLQEIVDMGEKLNMETMDAFHLGIPIREVPDSIREAENRLPRELVRAFASAELGGEVVGPNAIYIGRKLD